MSYNPRRVLFLVFLAIIIFNNSMCRPDEILPDAVLSVSPPSLDFGSSTVHRVANILNTGDAGSRLQWSAVADKPWIKIQAPTSGTTETTETDQLTIDVDRSTLSAGSYNGNVLVSSNGGDKSISLMVTRITWCGVEVLRDITDPRGYCVDDFEVSYTDTFVRVTYHADNSDMNGKVSRVNISRR